MLRCTASRCPTSISDDRAYDDYDADDVIEVGYNPAVPPETFDLIIVNEDACHRSIYGRWRAVLEYFDAYLVRPRLRLRNVEDLHQNMVSEYTYQQAVADGLDVDFDVLHSPDPADGAGRHDRSRDGGTQAGAPYPAAAVRRTR